MTFSEAKAYAFERFVNLHFTVGDTPGVWMHPDTPPLMLARVTMTFHGRGSDYKNKRVAEWAGAKALDSEEAATQTVSQAKVDDAIQGLWQAIPAGVLAGTHKAEPARPCRCEQEDTGAPR
jgi:hypothetical protein